MFSSFSEQTVVPDRLEVHWVCRRAWGPWEVESVWLEGPVMTAQGLDRAQRDGLLFAVDGAGTEGAPRDAPEWVRRIARRAGELEPEGRDLISA